MTPGGVIFFSTNFRRFKLAEEELRGRADPRDQPADGAARLPQPPHPSLLADGAQTAKRVPLRKLVGWVRRSEPHQKSSTFQVVGLAALDPPYDLTRRPL